ncbi:DUF4124 domain-containing protein [Luteimonas sp. RD2P54]|uniref:DUF4124 domain-containing protein n=1 Tax=Luteimonas endophytica TaxID=3042023 RepID=A0ABT6JD78_9GAMM|nr:DUF4124 domain-containing protein [Luteimonas endophytica]MDH5824771.1 DUF4124 domain-containing protein [Luteimonas endophytica]
MRPVWAVGLGLAAGCALAWWLSRDPPEVVEARQARAEAAAAANAEEARPVLYRWRDEAGNLQVTERPPDGRAYEKVDLSPREGIEIDGSRR